MARLPPRRRWGMVAMGGKWTHTEPLFAYQTENTVIVPAGGGC